MMMSEFTERTGFEPTAEEYAEIEEAYYRFDGDKDAFCASWKRNVGIEGICEARGRKIAQLRSTALETEKSLMAEIARRDKRIAELEALLEREQEWQPHEPGGIRQADYDALRTSGRQMTDEEAVDWVVAETGFQRERVRIIRSIPGEEIDRHRQIRRTDRMIDRSPVYDATDWHYILFRVNANVACCYELHNGELKPFAC